MGAADIVPGVSGGTIALIAGIYERLINALGSIGPNLWHIFRQEYGIKGFVAVWRRVDATFLLFLLLGIASRFYHSSRQSIKHLLDHQPLLIWSFFFGLVIATVFLLLSEIKCWNIGRAILFVSGLVIAMTISNLPILATSPSLPYLFFAGAIAICAMILPGVSGSFILLLLGAYDAVLEAVDTMNLSVIFTVVAGMATGLLLFTRALKWLLARYYQATLALLTGFIAGSLVKVWPWKVDALGTLRQPCHQQCHAVALSHWCPLDNYCGSDVVGCGIGVHAVLVGQTTPLSILTMLVHTYTPFLKQPFTILLHGI